MDWDAGAERGGALCFGPLTPRVEMDVVILHGLGLLSKCEKDKAALKARCSQRGWVHDGWRQTTSSKSTSIIT
jgi:hypothetical protein